MTPAAKARIPVAAVDCEAAPLSPAVVPAVTVVLASGRYILGPEVAAFEAELGAACAVGSASGTDALVLALRARYRAALRGSAAKGVTAPVEIEAARVAATLAAAS